LNPLSSILDSVFYGKPIIGITGGIGSGKSFVARLFGEMGCCVIHADDQIRLAYDDPDIRKTLTQWWGSTLFKPDGTINRPEMARRIFSNEPDRLRLEGLLHPWIATRRDQIMADAVKNSEIIAFIWDTPLLLEAGLDQHCDAVVFVDAPEDTRIRRVTETRGWNPAEIANREKLQWPLDKKRKLAHYIVANTADAAAARSQVQEILSSILAK